MTKQEIFNKHINQHYENVNDILNNDEYTEEDLKWYLRFRDSDRLRKTFQDWLQFRGLVNKIKRVGINGVLMRSDVSGVERGVEDYGRGNIVKYYIVKTDYGDVWVNQDGRQIAHIR